MEKIDESRGYTREQRMAALEACDRLGVIGAQRFVALMNRKSFGYTEWRRGRFEGMDVRELSRMAMASKGDGGDAGCLEYEGLGLVVQERW